MAYTHLEPGKELEVSERVYFHAHKDNVPTLVTLPITEITRMEKQSVEKEQAIYGRVLDVVKEWIEQAGQTVDLRRAKQYLRTPHPDHTANLWVEKQYEWYELSNMVYKMTYRIYEGTNYRAKGKPLYWELSWYLTFNTPQDPDFTGPGWRIAGQERKRFDDKASMEKYLQGHIRAYANLFTELSPPIPKEHKKRFCINGVLLPGYTVDSPDALKPDETKVDELLAFLEDGEIGGEAPAPPPEPEPEAPSPQAVWEKHRKQRTGASQRKRAPTR